MEQEIVENIVAYSKGQKPGPIKLDLFLTQGCNLKCVFCRCHEMSKEKLKKELDENQILKLIEESLKLGVKKFGLLGGEPFFKTDLMLKVMDKIKNGNACGAITTNGTLFNHDSIKKIVSMKWDMIRFSIDGDNPKTHDRLRGVKGSFKSCIKALETFQQVKEELKSDSPQIEFSVVLCKPNYKELKGIIKLAKKVGCKKVYFLPVIELTENVKKLKIDQKKSEKYIKDAEQLARSQNIHTNLRELINEEFIEKTEHLDQVLLKKGPQKSILKIPCYQPWYGLAVHANGRVVPCANFSDREGESFTENSLKEIWFGKYFDSIRRKLSGEIFPNACSRCCMPLVEENKIIKEMLKNLLNNKK